MGSCPRRGHRHPPALPTAFHRRDMEEVTRTDLPRAPRCCSRGWGAGAAPSARHRSEAVPADPPRMVQDAGAPRVLPGAGSACAALAGGGTRGTRGLEGTLSDRSRSPDLRTKTRGEQNVREFTKRRILKRDGPCEASKETFCSERWTPAAAEGFSIKSHFPGPGPRGRVAGSGAELLRSWLQGRRLRGQCCCLTLPSEVEAEGTGLVSCSSTSAGGFGCKGHGLIPPQLTLSLYICVCNLDVLSAVSSRVSVQEAMATKPWPGCSRVCRAGCGAGAGAASPPGRMGQRGGGCGAVGIVQADFSQPLHLRSVSLAVQ
ncbi:uncharacterized protein [Patagioenas fasciata]|uniref:uncharacterized protein n=1 Tax=Patagioenas fasciata TaxID=372321 RepID=UPI003A98E884